MITFRTYLRELTNRPLPYTWTGLWNFGGRRATFTADNGMPYKVFFAEYGGQADPHPQFPMPTQPSWEVVFQLLDTQTDGHEITGTGMSLQVFSTVVAIMQDFVRQVHPVQFYFTAKEPSRQRLYRLFARQVTRYFPGWRSETRPAWRGNPVETYWFVKD